MHTQAEYSSGINNELKSSSVICPDDNSLGVNGEDAIDPQAERNALIARKIELLREAHEKKGTVYKASIFAEDLSHASICWEENKRKKKEKWKTAHPSQLHCFYCHFSEWPGGTTCVLNLFSTKFTL